MPSYIVENQPAVGSFFHKAVGGAWPLVATALTRAAIRGVFIGQYARLSLLFDDAADYDFGRVASVIRLRVPAAL